MSWIVEPGPHGIRLVCGERLDIYEAVRFQRVLVDVAVDARPVEIDLGACEELDCAAVQLLLAFRRARAASNLPTTLSFGSSPALALLRRLGVEHALTAAG